MVMSRYASRVRPLGASSTRRPVGTTISLGGGYAFPQMLPDISAAAAAVALQSRVESLQYGPHAGVPALRNEIVRFLAEDGIQATQENILVLNGAKQGLDLAARLFLDKGDTVIVSRPNYATGLHILRNHQAKFLEIEMDGEGMQTDALERCLEARHQSSEPAPKMLYVTPDFHNPVGVTLSEARRRRLVELAKVHDFMIIEDDPYRRIKFGGPFVPPIKVFDDGGYVIGLGTVSKIFAPGVRIGWANAAPELIRLMTTMKSDGGSCPFTQLIIAEMLRSGEIARHTDALSTELRTHRDAMVDSLRTQLPDAKFYVPQGGYYLWVELPPHVDSNALTAMAEESGVLIFSGDPYFASRQPGTFIRLCYSHCTPGEIEKGIAILGDVVRRMGNTAKETHGDSTPRMRAQADHLD